MKNIIKRTKDNIIETISLIVVILIFSAAVATYFAAFATALWGFLFFMAINVFDIVVLSIYDIFAPQRKSRERE